MNLCCIKYITWNKKKYKPGLSHAMILKDSSSPSPDSVRVWYTGRGRVQPENNAHIKYDKNRI